MKTYKIITIKQSTFSNVDKMALEVETLLNEKCNVGWELVDISWVSFSTNMGGSVAYLTFRY